MAIYVVRPDLADLIELIRAANDTNVFALMHQVLICWLLNILFSNVLVNRLMLCEILIRTWHAAHWASTLQIS